jgi:pimeloyl-ACP methyl ester carboxylesterase
LRLADLPAPSFAEAAADTRTNSNSNRARVATKASEILYFDSRGARCEALLLRPDSQEDSTPLVVMAHGFAAEKSFGLQPYADHFLRRGLAVMMFDYRHFGGSEGTPRNLVSHRRQRQDWQAALDFAGDLPGIDASHIALWGTSFSGGHVLDCAARNANVAAVVAQVPMLDVPGSLRGNRTRYFTQAIWHGVRDLLHAATFRSPHRVPVVGPNRTFAVMNKPGCESGYRRLIPEDADWRNSVPARAVLTSLLNRPIRRAGQVTCPTLFVVAEQDQLAPARVVRKAAARMPDAKVVTLPGDHFAPYFDETFAAAVEQEADFLEGCLIKAVTWSISAGRDEESGDSEERTATKNRVA